MGLRKIIKISSVGTFCLGIFGSNPAYCSAPEEFGDEYSRFIESAIKVRQDIMKVSYENIAQMGLCAYRPQGFNLVTTKDEDGQRIVECKTWTMNNVQGSLKTGTSDLDLAFVSPKGFFVVTDTPENPLKGLAYTRSGDFMYDRDGYLLNSAGYYLMGWKLDESEVIPTDVNTRFVDSLELINAVSSPVIFRPTTLLDVRVNLPADAFLGVVHQVNTCIIDSLVVDICENI